MPVVVLAPLPLWWQPGGSDFLGVSLFGNSSESCEEAGRSAYFKAAATKRSLWDWAGSPNRRQILPAPADPGGF